MKYAAALLALCSWTAAALAEEDPNILAPPVRSILTANSFWRWHVARATGAAAAADPLGGPPPADWIAVEFDDSAWPRSRPAWFNELVGLQQSNGELDLRGRFAVTDPKAAGELTLVCKAHGTVTVFLNGKPAPAPRGEAAAALPANLLRRGVNVLAIRIARSPGDAGAVAIYDVRLIATGDGVVPNCRRPRGLQVWNQDVNDRVTERDYGDPNEPLRPIRIEGARNGDWRGEFVISSTEPLKGTKVTASDLAAQGGGRIAASDVSFFFARPDAAAYKYFWWYDGLSPDAPEVSPVLGVRRWAQPTIPDGSVLPVLVRVHVPADAAPGDYRGQATVHVAGERPVAVPVEVHVADWAVPNQQDYRTYIGIYQSPTTLSMQYGCPEWSEEHWRLMAKSFELLSRAGNRLVNVLLSEQTQFGNDRGMVYWVPKGDGAYDYDFTIFDRFMQLAMARCKRLDHVALHLWHSGGWETRKADEHNTVTVKDPGTGEFSRLQVPVFGTEESKRFWKPVLDAIRARLTKLGLADAMCLGILSDGTAPPEVFAMFDEIWGSGRAKWMRGLHRQSFTDHPYGLGRSGGQVVLHEFCYGLGLPRPTDPFPPIHTYGGRPGAAYNRISGHLTAATLVWYHTFPEQSLVMGTKGVGRICLDFWPVLKTAEGHREWIYNRYPFSSCAQRAPSLERLTWPSPAGPETTLRYEMFCEGVQAAEAMIVLSEAVAEHADALGEPLATRCRNLLRDRVQYCRVADQKLWARVYYQMNHYGWQDLARRLYECAADATHAEPIARR